MRVRTKHRIDYRIHSRTHSRTKQLAATLACALGLTANLAPRAHAAESQPRVIKPSLVIMVTRYLRYFPTPTAKEPIYNTWSWQPRFNFMIGGPLDAGSQVSISFYKPDGSLWNNPYTDTHFLDKNPGDYEIKVLVRGQLARVAAFKVGADGQIVNNGIADNNGMTGMNLILPVKVLPGADIKALPASSMTDAFYGNPLNGFLIP